MTEKPIDIDYPPTPVDPYDPPLAEITTPAFEQPRPRGNRRLVVLVAALGVALFAGVAVTVALVWPSGEGEAAPRPAANPSASAVPSASVIPSASSGDEADAWAELPALPGTAASTLRATDGGPQTRVQFVNTTSESVSIVWVGYDGQRSSYAELAAGEKYLQDTYVGHVWLAARADGSEIAVFQPTAQPARAIIRLP